MENTPPQAEIDPRSALLTMLLEQRYEDFADCLTPDGRNDKLVLVGPDLPNDPKTSTRAEITYYPSDRQSPEVKIRYGTKTSTQRFRIKINIGEGNQYELPTIWKLRSSDEETWDEIPQDSDDYTSAMIKAYVNITQARPETQQTIQAEQQPTRPKTATTFQRVRRWLGGLSTQGKS